MLNDLTGRFFRRLTVIRRAETRITPSGQRKTRWECKCSCGSFAFADSQSLKSGKVGSCGCLASDETTRRNTKHGRTRTKEYRAWAHAKDRCHRESDPKYPLYGARGIAMCATWRASFEAFFESMGPAPSKKHTLERLNGSMGYTPGNCVWATRKSQSNNLRSNVRVVFQGVEMTLAQAAEVAKVDYKSLHHFYRTRGLSFPEAVFAATPLE